ncbi:MAG: hypothetical protein DRJ31_01645 [Candidatus Methanomethylicota archaeon]|uniref:Uncharacterized protein n=1 Tax=Thermoproteota archaeon TaxID=2056631 RepID=A0A497EUJ4_9CREN|nr:MAG: hypothetical protein DRJ31_01645 [Candidatus Verstraetearchaeota archaeon]
MSSDIYEAKPGYASMVFALVTSITFIGESIHYLSPLLFWLKNPDLLAIAVSLTLYSLSYTAAVYKLLRSKERNAIRLVGLAGGLICTFSLLLLAFGTITPLLILIAASLGFSLGILLSTAYKFSTPKLTSITFLGPLVGVLIIRGKDVDFYLFLFAIAILVLSYIMLIPARFVYVSKPTSRFDFNLPKVFIITTSVIACGLSTATLLIPIYILDVLKADLSLIGVALTGGLLLMSSISSFLARYPPPVAPRMLSSLIFVESVMLICMMFFYNPLLFTILWIVAFAIASMLGSLIAVLARELGGVEKSAATNLVFSFGSAFGPLIACLLWLAYTPRLMFGFGVLLCMSSGIVLRHYLAKKIPYA